MSIIEEDQLSKRLGMQKRKRRWIKERKDSRCLFSGTSLKYINKDS
jgi:hypothetical protein